MSSRARPSVLFCGRVVVALALAGAVLPCAAQSIFNPATDFSAASNPGGVWSYGYANFPGPLTLFPLTSTFGSASVPAWRNSEIFPNSYPVAFYNASGAPVVYSGSLTLPTGQLGLHPGDVGAAVARLTLPAGGTFLLNAVFVGIESDGGGTTTDAHVYVNGTSVFDGTISGLGSTATFSNYQFTASAGWFVDFVVGSGGNGVTSDTTGLAASVVAVPEPQAFAGGIALVVLGFAVARRKNGKAPHA